MSKSMLHVQLRRMRAMNFKYHSLFFRQINFWIALNGLLLVASLLEPLRAAVLLIPYLVLCVAMQGAFHFHYIVFARRYARARTQAQSVERQRCTHRAQIGRGVPVSSLKRSKAIIAPKG